MSVCYVILAFVVGAFFTGLDLITAKYPRTWFLVKKSKSLWGYCALYGAIAAGVYLGLDGLVAAKKIQLSSEVLESPWLRILVIGISVKSLLHINLFTTTVNSQPFPVGLGTFTLLFEPQLLRSILFDEFNAVRSFIAPIAARHPNIETVRTTIMQNIPPELPTQETGAFRDELGKATDVAETLERGLRFLGRKTFSRVFP
jgi:hypothetical protein